MMSGMLTYKVERTSESWLPFQVRGPDGLPAVEINEFLVYMMTCGRSGYTLRSYATGLAHFFGWLHESGIDVNGVSRSVVGQYIGTFSRGSKGGACVSAKRSAQNNEARHDRVIAEERQPRTINHRLSVLASYFAYRIRQDEERGSGPWFQKANPSSTDDVGPERRHRMQGRDLPLRRRTGEFRRRVPKKIPKQFNPGLAERLIAAAVSWRDKAILTLLLRTGQRIGDWSEIAGTHGVLGMTLADFDRVHGMITVRLKGARDEHRVPITDDFWPLFDKYVAHERLTSVTTPAAWLGLRRSAGQPLTYAAFESSLRYTARKIGLKVHAHMFRHTLAQGVLDTTGNLKLAQEILGHAHLSTTADLYMHLDHSAMIDALASVKASFDKEQHTTGVSARALPECYAFPYDAITLEELEKVATQAQPSRGEKDDGGSDGPNGKRD
jgi:integrase/recombinase XerD